MSYQFIKMTVYIFAVLLAMYGLSCFNYEAFIRKGQLKAFYALYICLSLGIGYLVAEFILNFATIHLF